MTEPTSKTSPFVIAASIAVIIFSIVGIGAFTGLIPSRGTKAEAPPTTSAPAETGTATGQPAAPPQPSLTAQAEIPAATPVAEEKPTVKPEPAAKKPAHRATSEKSAARPAPANEAAMAENRVPANVCANCGVITAIRTVEQAGEGSGLGAIAGGVAGALLGSQIGSGRGRDVATIAGAVGGGYAGHQVEKKVKTTKHYEITVRMDDGSHRTMVQEAEPVFAIGDKVKIIDGALVRN